VIGMMRPNRPASVLEDADHMYYVYSSKLFPMYRMHGINVRVGFGYGPPGKYDFSSDLVRRTGFGRPLTVERIIATGYFAIPKSDPVKAVISDRKDTSRLGLDGIIGQIRHRYEVYERNMYDLELAKCSVINTFYTHEAWHGPSDSRLEYSVGKRLDKLYKDQREERLNLWRDVSRLKLLLPEKAQEYLAAYRKASILEDTEGDGP